mgnify:CR=1 FL=1|tara:strand:+ start:4784 stop:5308 length:525 start_codon:yes stop_codon:yes gene_type:complete
MPLAVTHIILTIIAVDIYRDYFMKAHKKFLTLHTILIAGIAGMLPDIDIALNWFLGAVGYQNEILMHGALTHTLAFSLIFLIPGYYFYQKKNYKWAMYFFVISFGIFFHLFLDFLLGGGRAEGIMWFWPFSSVGYKIHLLLKANLNALPQGIDALILLAWLWHEEVKHKIKDFI